MTTLYIEINMGKYAALSSLPFLLLASIGGGYYIGKAIDDSTGFKYANVIGLVLGFAIGLYEVMRQLKRWENRKDG